MKHLSALWNQSILFTETTNWSSSSFCKNINSLCIASHNFMWSENCQPELNYTQRLLTTESSGKLVSNPRCVVVLYIMYCHACRWSTLSCGHGRHLQEWVWVFVECNIQFSVDEKWERKTTSKKKGNNTEMIWGPNSSSMSRTHFFLRVQMTNPFGLPYCFTSVRWLEGTHLKTRLSYSL